MDILDLVVFDGFREADEYAPEAYTFTVQGADNAKLLYNALIETDMQQWPDSINGCNITLEMKGTEPTALYISLLFTDDSGMLCESWPYSVDEKALNEYGRALLQRTK